MSIKRKLFLLGILSLGGLSTAGTLGQETEEAQYDPRFCLTCHGENGRGNEIVQAPRLAGMERWYLQRQMQLFSEGLRGTHPEDLAGREMQPMAEVLTGSELTDVLDWAETWEAGPAEPTIEGDTQRGGQLYRQFCQTCHGADGGGNQALGAPALAGQSDWYTVTQLRNYREGYRGYDPEDTRGVQMQAMAQTLPDDQAVLDVVSYINTLSP